MCLGQAEGKLLRDSRGDSSLLPWPDRELQNPPLHPIRARLPHDDDRQGKKIRHARRNDERVEVFRQYGAIGARVAHAICARSATALSPSSAYQADRIAARFYRGMPATAHGRPAHSGVLLTETGHALSQARCHSARRSPVVDFHVETGLSDGGR